MLDTLGPSLRLTIFKRKHTISLRFAGQVFDADTGLHYNYFRDYDPWTGRYIQSDPIGLEGGLNTYGYVGGNPLRFIDPEGLQAGAIGVGGAAASGAGIACMVSTVGIVSAVGYSSYWITDTYINPWLQPIISEKIDDFSNSIDELLTYSKGGKQNVRDTGLINVSDEEINRRLKDSETSPQERKRLNKEQKGRGERNKRKRKE